jgi:hypothetical protein
MNKGQTVIYGASDDLIEIEGAFSEELGGYDFDGYLACSDGTLLRVKYEGEWRFTRVRAGTIESKIIPSVGDDNSHEGEYSRLTSYSDIVVFDGKLTWVLQGKSLAKA